MVDGSERAIFVPVMRMIHDEHVTPCGSECMSKLYDQLSHQGWWPEKSFKHMMATFCPTPFRTRVAGDSDWRQNSKVRAIMRIMSANTSKSSYWVRIVRKAHQLIQSYRSVVSCLIISLKVNATKTFRSLLTKSALCARKTEEACPEDSDNDLLCRETNDDKFTQVRLQQTLSL